MSFGHLNKNLYKETGDESVKNSNVAHAQTTSKSLKECLKWSGGIYILLPALLIIQILGEPLLLDT